MKAILNEILGVAAMVTISLGVVTGAQGQDGRPPGAPLGPGGPGPGGLGPPELKVVKRFDRDADSRLNRKERAAARKHVQAVRKAEPERRGPGGRGPRPPVNAAPPKPGKQIKPGEVVQDQKSDLYDPKVLRTLFIDFENADSYEELNDFYRTDVEVEARLTVDGEIYPRVGVKLRGNTSSIFVAPGRKKSLGVSIDFEDPDLRLHGYKTLNLLNSHTDPTFMREMLFGAIARRYLPSAKVNYVRVVVNGENWGIYINAQQYNKDFLDDWFDTRKGVRWKVPANPREAGGLTYLGSDLKKYEEHYELKSAKDEGKAWADLVNLTKVLNETPVAELEAALDPILAIDRALWFMALDNVLIDNDGYWVRASDFLLYQDKSGRFHPIPHDNNETFRRPGGPGLGDRVEGVKLDPLHGAGDKSKPLMRLVEVPHLRARYLAHVRTLTDEWLRWEKLASLVQSYQGMIANDVREDTRKLYSSEAFLKGMTESVEGEPGRRGPRMTIGLKEFADQRRSYLLAHPEMARSAPMIGAVTHRVQGGSRAPLTTDTVEVTATVEGKVDSVFVHHSDERTGRFQPVAMAAGGRGIFRGVIPAMPAGTKVHYYVEARVEGAKVSSRFFPAGTEFEALTYTVAAPEGSGSSLIISEVMASNGSTLADPQGEYDDWIELRNLGDTEVDLSGMYLSDKEDNPRKWRIPNGTKLAAGGYLVVWADEDGKATPGLHANFKLSKKGEKVWLFDNDARKNVKLDSIEFGKLGEDEAFGRSGSGDKGKVLAKPTPGLPNG